MVLQCSVLQSRILVEQRVNRRLKNPNYNHSDYRTHLSFFHAVTATAREIDALTDAIKYTVPKKLPPHIPFIEANMKSVNIFCQTTKIIDITVAFSIEQKFNIVAHLIESKTTKAGLYTLEKRNESVMKAIKKCAALYLSPLRPKNSSDWEFLDRCESKLIEITEFDPTGKNIVLCSLRLFAKKSLIEPSFNLLVKPLLSHATKGIMINQTAYPKDYLDAESISDGSIFRLSLDDKPVQVRPILGQPELEDQSPAGKRKAISQKTTRPEF